MQTADEYGDEEEGHCPEKHGHDHESVDNIEHCTQAVDAENASVEEQDAEFDQSERQNLQQNESIGELSISLVARR